MKRAVLFPAALVLACAAACGCSSGRDGATYAAGTDASTDGTTTGVDASTGDGPMSFGDGASSCPSTCAELGANCGPVTDAKCGGIIECGTCPQGSFCGGGGAHSVCGNGDGGGGSDACSPMACQSQNLTCGQAGDGCGKVLQCGSCNLPQSCGGDPAKPGQCGCTGLCAQVPTCAPGVTTTLTGTVYDPAGLHPLYDALVYVPNNVSDPGLKPFPAGVKCDQCGATAAGDPLVTSYTAPDGTFTLSGVPVGASVPLVVQLGRWRRQVTVNIATSCGPNAVPDKTLTMPKNHGEGDLPRIAVLSGSLDTVECAIRKIGVQDTEFTDPGVGGYINFYLANATDTHSTLQGSGAKLDATTPGQAALFATSGGTPVINGYDMVIVECEGYPQSESASDLAALKAYAEAGGRVFTSDFAYAWLYQNGNFASAATWAVNQGYAGTQSASVDLVSNPKGPAFQQWLNKVGIATPTSITPVYRNSNAVVAPTQQWLYWGSTTPLHFTFNTPVGAAAAKQCGRVVFSDWHAEDVDSLGTWSTGKTFPAECPAGPMTAQEAILEFMFFDLSACVQPYTPLCTPSTCTSQSISCGYASDGCGNLLDCGKCAAGQTCGGGGAGKCGTSSNCTPETCASQGIQCGPAGDGCGGAITCGNCPTGQICGVGGPGKCGGAQ